MITDKGCPIHEDKECDKCSYYVITMSPWNNPKTKYRMWVGDSASASFGPMGMEDDILIEYHATVAPMVER